MKLYREVQRYDDNTIKTKYMVLRFYENQRKMAKYILDEMDDAYYTFTDMGIAFEDEKGREYFEWAYEYEDVKEANEIKDIYKESKKKFNNNLTNKFKKNKVYDKATKEYNNIMLSLGYDHLTVGTGFGEKTDNWNLRDMVSEMDYQLSTFYESGHLNSELKDCDYKAWKNETSRLKKFIKNYEPLTRKMNCYEGHYSKYD